MSIRWPLIVRLLSITASIAGLAMVPFTIQPIKDWGSSAYVLLAMSLLALIVFVILEIRTERTRKVFKLADKKKIRDYMYSWIKYGGPVVVWTRDHSWVDDDEMRRLLQDKAKNKSLTICVPELTDYCSVLIGHGADVVVHQFAPAVRFTIANCNKATFSVALARPGSDLHVIEEYDHDHPVASLARDLVEFAKLHRSSNP